MTIDSTRTMTARMKSSCTVGRLRHVTKHVAIFLHEFIKARVLTTDFFNQHFIQFMKHLLHPVEVTGAHVVDHVLNVLKKGLCH